MRRALYSERGLVIKVTVSSANMQKTGRQFGDGPDWTAPRNLMQDSGFEGTIDISVSVVSLRDHIT